MKRGGTPRMRLRMKLSPKQREALKLVADGKFFPDFVKEEDGWHARWRAVSVDNGWVDEYVRAAAVTRLSEDAEDQKHETLHDAWMMALKSRTGLVVWDDAECAAFAAELRDWSGAAEEDVAARRQVKFTFAPFKVVCTFPRNRRGLKALGQSIYVFPPLRGMRGDTVELTRAEAESFVRVGAKDLRDAGYTVEGVDLAAAISAEAELLTPESADDTKKVELKLTVKVAGEAVTAAEIRFLLDQGSSLVYFRDRWIEVDRDLLRQALRALEKKNSKVASPLTFAMGLGRIGSLELEEVKTHGWLRGLVNTLRGQGGLAVASAETIPGLNGTLRPYQARGVAWLEFLTSHGFGALLADDMGLGKTIQTIAWALRLRQQPNNRTTEQPDNRTTERSNNRTVLIVAPLTLLSNWEHEFAKFAPSLKVYVHHGDLRRLGSGFRRAAGEADVVVTSYNLLVKDYSSVSEVAWSGLVLDEAQAIKNPDTQVAKAVRALTPPNRIALTGTPVENTVGDIWSIEEFLNPGFLGDRKHFEEHFVKPLGLDEQSAAGKRLKYALEPFVLRRLKSDPEIAAELGPKREIKEYCALSPEQRKDYELALEDFRVHDHTQGDVFALLTNLKLICDGAGKLERLYELLEAIFASGESALVFTQYAKVGAMLQKELLARFGRRFPFLHGGLSASAREAQIRLFNSGARTVGTAFILSLKAGGFGLNLTKATHVIHFDRWWNPAVENQATDRAHRIGQDRTVFVHQFITTGTLEEHVDEILERKSRVAGAVITEMEWLEAARLSEQTLTQQQPRNPETEKPRNFS